MNLTKQWPILILGLLIVGGWGTISYSDSPSFRTSLSVTLEQMNRLKRSLAQEPLPVAETTSPTPEDLEQKSLVEQTVKEAQSEVSPLNSQESYAVVEAISVTKEGIVIKINGKEPQTSLAIDPVTEKLSLSLQGAVLATSVPINRDDSAQGIESLKVSQRFEEGLVKISLDPQQQNWQVSSIPQGLLLSPAPMAQVSTPPQVESVAKGESDSKSDSKTENSSPENHSPTSPETVSSLPEDVIPTSDVVKPEENVSPTVETKTAQETTTPGIETQPPEEVVSPVVENQSEIQPSAENSPPTNLGQISDESATTEEQRAEDKRSEETITPSVEVTTPEITTPLLRQPIRLLHLNTANQLLPGELQVTYSQTTRFGGSSSGTGNQTYFSYTDWGLTDDLQIGWSYMINDDPTYRAINGINIPQQYQALGPNLKYRFYKDNNWGLSVFGSLEQFQIYSGPGLFNNYESPTVSNTIAGTLQIPISYSFNDQLQVTFTPAVNIFSNGLNGVPFYGTVFNLGFGGNWRVSDQLSFFANTVIPLSGSTSFNTARQFSKSILWTLGSDYAFNKAIAVQLYVTNVFGATPTTSVLTLPTTSNEILLGGQFFMVPSAKEIRRTNYSDHQEKLQFDWFTLTTPYIVPTDGFQLRVAGDSQGSIGGSVAYGFLQDYQFEALLSSIGGFDTQSVINAPQGTELQWRFGGKLLFLDQADGDPLSASGRITIGRDFGNKQGYMMVEFPFMYELNSQWAALFSPKAAINGGNTPVGLGLGINYAVIPEVQLIGEVTPMVTGERTVWAAGVRVFPINNLAIDLLGTNSTSQFDLGELIAEPGTRVAASIQWKFGGHSQQNSRVNPNAVSEPSNSEHSSLDPQSSVEHLHSQN